MHTNKHKKLRKRSHLKTPSYGVGGIKGGAMLSSCVTEMILKSSL